MIHGNQTKHVPDAYKRYLANVFRETFDLFASPVAIEFRTDANPYDRGIRRPADRAPSGRRGRRRGRKE